MTSNRRLVTVLAVAGLLALFILQNTAVVDVRLLFWTVSMSRALMFFILIAIGVGIGWYLRGHFRNRRTP